MTHTRPLVFPQERAAKAHKEYIGALYQLAIVRVLQKLEGGILSDYTVKRLSGRVLAEFFEWRRGTGSFSLCVLSAPTYSSLQLSIVHSNSNIHPFKSIQIISILLFVNRIGRILVI